MLIVIPAKAGIQKLVNKWIPACAGMTTWIGRSEPSFIISPTAQGNSSPLSERLLPFYIDDPASGRCADPMRA